MICAECGMDRSKVFGSCWLCERRNRCAYGTAKMGCKCNGCDPDTDDSGALEAIVAAAGREFRNSERGDSSK